MKNENNAVWFLRKRPKWRGGGAGCARGLEVSEALNESS
jgi:hypothetical protein